MLLVLCAVAAGASALTFVSGFGLGTILLPAFALFYPVEQAVASTAVVHFLNGLFKVGLVGRHADRTVVLLFGLPAIAAALVGAWTLDRLAGAAPLARYQFLGIDGEITFVKLVVGALLLAFTLLEMIPQLRAISFSPAHLPLGGVLSGFFGGLSGLQGALRSAFLVRAGLSKEAYVASGVVIACLIDLGRIGVYARSLSDDVSLDYGTLGGAVAAAFAGSWLGNRFLKKTTLRSVQRIVAVMLAIFAVGLVLGWL
ncbi:MAG TPA: sulfite exporter TauE/SafE family protein [Vicinamibacterales bacterium]|nr:sulfite exporter TauE/SafE family protein [Vicinamibacterales bacterium]